VQQVIDDYRSGRISDAEYLRRVSEQLATVRQGHETEMPEQLTQYTEAPAYYGVVGEVLEGYGPEPAQRKQIAADMAIAIQQIIDPLKGRDWVVRDDIQKEMANAIDDFLFEAREKFGVSMNTADMDTIIERCLSIARKLAGG